MASQFPSQLSSASRGSSPLRSFLMMALLPALLLVLTPHHQVSAFNPPSTRKDAFHLSRKITGTKFQRTTREVPTELASYHYQHSSGSPPNPRGAKPLPLSASDLDRLTGLQSNNDRPKEQRTMPIVVMDALLPGQKLFFQSPDPKFEQMLKYLWDNNHSEIGIIGFNPNDGQPLNMGVTASVVKEEVTFGLTRESERVMATSFKGDRRFVVVGEPWMDPTESFHLATVELADQQSEQVPIDLESNAQRLHEKIPALVDEWMSVLLQTEMVTPATIGNILKELGHMPSTFGKRAIWVGALVNPMIPLKVCLEIRPAMLACSNDHDRLILASTALQSSINHITGKDKLF